MADLFIGRGDELGTLIEVVARADAGAGRLVLISGEPGIGKTRLVEELARAPELQGCTVAWGRCWEGPGTPAYWPWLQVLRHLGLELEAPAAGDQHEARFRLFDAVTQRLLALAGAAARPLVIALDDAHAADQSSLLLLQFVARNLRASRIAIVATSRDSWFHASPQTSGLLAKIARDALHLPLGRLGLDDVTRWMTVGAPQLTSHVQRVFDASEGNPLFVGELVAAARKQPAAAWTSAAALPHGVREAIRAHLALLSAPAARLLEIASVHGREFGLAALADQPGVTGLLEEATALGLLGRGHPDRLRFAHVLLRDELYGQLSPQRRAELHRAIAAAATDVNVAAHHHVLGADREHAGAASQAVLTAIRAACQRYAFEDAAQLGERALGTLAPYLEPSQEYALRIAVGEACVLADRDAAGHAMCTRAAELAAATGDAQGLAHAALVAGTRSRLGRSPTVIDLLRRALAALPPGDSTLRAQTMARLSNATIPPLPSEVADTQQLRSESVAMARRLGDEVTLFETLRLSNHVFPELVPLDERIAFNTEAVALAARLGREAHAVSLFTARVQYALEQADLDGARRSAAHAERRLSEFRQPQFHWRAPLLHMMLASLSGDFAAADAHSREALRIAREHELFEGMVMFGVARCAMAFNRGDDEGHAEFAPLVLETQSRLGQSGPYLAIVHAAGFDRERTAHELALRNTPVEVLPGSGALAFAALRAGANAEARRLYHDGREHFGRVALHFGPSGVMGPSPLLLGQLAALDGDDAAAEAHYTRALAFCEKLQARPYMAQTQLAWAQLLARRGARDSAKMRAEAAYRSADALGMRRVAAEAAALADTGPPSPPAPPPAAPAVAQLRFTITRQGELWSLAGNGPPILLKDSKGLAYLELLVREPGREIHVLDLIGAEPDGGDAGPQLDARAKQSYRDRADELRESIAEATRLSDLGRLERDRAELDFIADELARAVGLGGRDRRAASQAERARINVQRRLRDVIRRTADVNPWLGLHLEHSLQTGLFCSYVPTWPARA